MTGKWWEKVTAEFQDRVSKPYNNCRKRMEEIVKRRTAYKAGLGTGDAEGTTSKEQNIDDYIEWRAKLDEEQAAGATAKERANRENWEALEQQLRSVQTMTARQRTRDEAFELPEQDSSDSENDAEETPQRQSSRNGGRNTPSSTSRSSRGGRHGTPRLQPTGMDQIAGSLTRLIDIEAAKQEAKNSQRNAATNEVQNTLEAHGQAIRNLQASVTNSEQLLHRLIANLIPQQAQQGTPPS